MMQTLPAKPAYPQPKGALNVAVAKVDPVSAQPQDCSWMLISSHALIEPKAPSFPNPLNARRGESLTRSVGNIANLASAAVRCHDPERPPVIGVGVVHPVDCVPRPRDIPRRRG